MEEKQRELDLHYTTGRYAVMWVSPCMFCNHLIEDGYLVHTAWISRFLYIPYEKPNST